MLWIVADCYRQWHIVTKWQIITESDKLSQMVMHCYRSWQIVTDSDWLLQIETDHYRHWPLQIYMYHVSINENNCNSSIHCIWRSLLKESVWNNHKGISNAPNFRKAKRKVNQRVDKLISRVYFTWSMFIFFMALYKLLEAHASQGLVLSVTESECLSSEWVSVTLLLQSWNSLELLLSYWQRVTDCYR